jgi:hypothetical protein
MKHVFARKGIQTRFPTSLDSGSQLKLLYYESDQVNLTKVKGQIINHNSVRAGSQVKETVLKCPITCSIYFDNKAKPVLSTVVSLLLNSVIVRLLLKYLISLFPNC